MSRAARMWGQVEEEEAWLAEKPDYSPFVVPKEDKPDRVLGWKDGQGLTRQKLEEVLKTDPLAKQEYTSVMKRAEKYRKAREVHIDPLVGLPPASQAFFRTVPHQDPKTAAKQMDAEERRRAKRKAASAALVEEAAEEAEDPAALERELEELREKIEKRKQALEEKQKEAVEWARRAAEIQSQDEKDQVGTRDLKRKLEDRSYKHGVLLGQIRSSDVTHRSKLEDLRQEQRQKVAALTRSCALMQKQIEARKLEVNLLLKAQKSAVSLDDGRSSRLEAPSTMEVPPPSIEDSDHGSEKGHR